MDIKVHEITITFNSMIYDIFHDIVKQISAIVCKKSPLISPSEYLHCINHQRINDGKKNYRHNCKKLLTLLGDISWAIFNTYFGVFTFGKFICGGEMHTSNHLKTRIEKGQQLQCNGMTEQSNMWLLIPPLFYTQANSRGNNESA